MRKTDLLRIPKENGKISIKNARYLFRRWRTLIPLDALSLSRIDQWIFFHQRYPIFQLDDIYTNGSVYYM